MGRQADRHVYNGTHAFWAKPAADLIGRGNAAVILKLANLRVRVQTLKIKPRRSVLLELALEGRLVNEDSTETL